MPLLHDPALADDGARKIEFAYRRMPVLSGLTDRWSEAKPLRGTRIAACLHVTTETANLCRAPIDELTASQHTYLTSWQLGT